MAPTVHYPRFLHDSGVLPHTASAGHPAWDGPRVLHGPGVLLHMGSTAARVKWSTIFATCPQCSPSQTKHPKEVCCSTGKWLQGRQSELPGSRHERSLLGLHLPRSRIEPALWCVCGDQGPAQSHRLSNGALHISGQPTVISTRMVYCTLVACQLSGAVCGLLACHGSLHADAHADSWPAEQLAAVCGLVPCRAVDSSLPIRGLPSRWQLFAD